MASILHTMAADMLNVLFNSCCVFGATTSLNGCLNGHYSKCKKCRSGFEALGDSCYHFSTETGTYLEGYEYCKARDSELISIETKVESDIINRFIVDSHNPSAPGNFWTSGFDFNRNRQFYWMGTGTNFSDTNWCSGEPNGPTYEYCVHIINNNVLLGTGTKFSHINWCSGEPNGPTYEYCVHIINNNGKPCWNDLACSSKQSNIRKNLEAIR
uniref:C-type lectin domain-containing protein n=1 Tax=Strigamia maritima TaxID=126957 RepID=T1J2G3_STRMM